MARHPAQNIGILSPSGLSPSGSSQTELSPSAVLEAAPQPGRRGARLLMEGFTLRTMTAAASWLAMQPTIHNQVIYSRYKIKLESCDHNLLLFLVKTLPVIAVAVPVYIICRVFSAIFRIVSR